MTPAVLTRFTVLGPAGPLACARWGSGVPGRPTALLVHGTGFCASVWGAVAIDLARVFDVVAFDRRGHGASAKPDDAYDFDDFADDVVAIVYALGLDGVYGIGHSAGGTDLLLAAPRRPHGFARLFLVEPTVMDPWDPTRDLDSAPGPDRAALERFERRRATFPSSVEARHGLEGRGIFSGWREDLLEAYIADGFESLPDGRVTLRCTPTIEGSMLRRIAAAMCGEHQSETFEPLAEIRCPVLVVTTEGSSDRYKRMASAVQRLVAETTIENLAGVGHAVPQVDPQRIAVLARNFWDRAVGRSSFDSWSATGATQARARPDSLHNSDSGRPSDSASRSPDG
jgi:pimeloyl-ACP methyl ester carboxylesterase